MLSSKQTSLFNSAYDAYRSILAFIRENLDVIDQKSDKYPTVVMCSDVELQRILLDISLCESHSLTDPEQTFIQSIIGSDKLLKSTIPGYAKFFRNMSAENYSSIKVKLEEMTQQIPIALQIAVFLKQKIGKDQVAKVIDNYRHIMDAFVSILDINDEEKRVRIDRWMNIFKRYVEDHGISYDTASDSSIRKASHEDLDQKTVEEYQKELSELVGLDEVKRDVNELVSILRVNELRRREGVPEISISKHLVFKGNPGTGKTTVARILTGIYKRLGVVSKGQLVEVDRSGLVAGYIGQTESKTQTVIEEAIGGVLFIDEAYELAKEGNDFGQVAIATILKAMEDRRDDLIVIAAGYPELMEQFINSNPGLRSRFTKYIEFPDYTADEMQEIFFRMIRKDGNKLDIGADQKLLSLWEQAQKDREFGNARGVRNVYGEIMAKQSMRIGVMSHPTKDDLITIKQEDIPDYVVKNTPEKRLGF